ncbi:ferredoxin-fold anticodon-binding domain-containing protein 1 isoform X2 [Hyla sarda]|uniref:ferredoxin-fold anticodon-binding domain-containing protein 1 isoform X2 n=1 Tax=Hyla sarda TaxID=327740 RepID=UPI0024C384F9|nr:ferredoxin-fold anticodon-binding domain-containing protein 1 isoform X2 [Hyla sarda]
MDQEKTFTVLLVGEGNFSFSSSLCDTSQEIHHITATCYEPEDVVCKQDLTWRNVQHLRSKGAEVYFGVDATKLHEYSFLSCHLYDRIIFNFPHCGRKAGVKKNRDLLSNFFHSCADVLFPKGEVHVALCQGQGGTPADQPKREWHNSWQVVAMAATAGFILSSVLPFDSDRSQEKSFHLIGALNHVFTRSLPVKNIKALQIIDMLTSVQDLQCDDAEVDRGFLGKTCHPINVLHKELIKNCEKNIQVSVIEDMFPLICPNNTCFHHTPHSFVMPDKGWSAAESSDDFYKKPLCSVEQDKKPETYLADICTNHTIGLYHLRPSLTCFMDDITCKSNFRPNVLTIVSGLVFRKCLVSLTTMPVYHEMLMLLDYRSNTPKAQLQLFIDTIKTAIDTIAASVISDATETVDVQKMERHSVRFNQKNEEEYTITMSPTHCDQIIGTIKVVPPKHQYTDSGAHVVTLNLDSIAMSLLDIKDWRLLWTEDKRFIEQFHHRVLKPFQSFSLYPPYYIHDVSFWVKGHTVFDDVEFHTIALRMSKGNIVNIQLLDQYENVETGNIGLCYRLIYQSCDRALSYKSALGMQLKLRDELHRCLQVTLR